MYIKWALEVAAVWINRKEHFVPAFRGFFLPYMNIAESGQSRMRAQQQHGKMLSLVDGVYKDISKQMRMDAMYKAADRQEPIDTGKSLNLLDLQLYSRNEQEQHALILAKNLMHGNQWLEDSALENPDNDQSETFYPPQSVGHKYTESDDDAMVEGLNLKRSSVSSTVTPEVKKHKGETSVEG